MPGTFSGQTTSHSRCGGQYEFHLSVSTDY
jgi:hypothetical protein